MRTLTDIRSEVDKLAGIISAPSEMLPTYGSSDDFGRPHIEISGCEYHYVVEDRGQETSRFTTVSFDDLLFQIFRNVTFGLAMEFELEHRVELQDCRRIMFDRQIRLLSMLSSDWASRRTAEHKKILDAHPFDDFAGYYASRISGYTEVGFTYSVACKLASLAVKRAKLAALFQRFIKGTRRNGC